MKAGQNVFAVSLKAELQDKMDTLSIIIPHKDIPHLLRRCLDSIPQRDGIQIIVVDDNSSADIVDFDDFPGKNRPDVKLVFDRKGGGAGYARNIGLGFADSRWVMFADADDYFVPDFLEVVSKYFDSNVDAVMFKIKTAKSESGEEPDMAKYTNSAIDEGLEGCRTVRQSFAAVNSPWAKLLSLEFIRSKQITFDEIHLANDAMFSSQIACFGSLLGLSDEVIYTHTSRAGSLTANRYTHHDFLARWKVQCRCNKLLIANGISIPWMGVKLKVAWNIGMMTFLGAIWRLIENGLLFAGMSHWLYNKICRK